MNLIFSDPDQTRLQNTGLHDDISRLIASANQIVLGKEKQIKLVLSALFAGSHVLLNDLPGVGKTTLALAIAKLSGLDYQRVQFTSDLLPADITGVSIFDPAQQEFKFHKGPIFAGLVLIDEINRATPKAQSALLECMEERQVSVDGQTFALPEPFFVIATQNPKEQIGTYSLPESQLDRFAMQIQLGYPDSDSERTMLTNGDPRAKLSEFAPLLDSQKLSTIAGIVKQCYCAESILDYLQSLVAYTRAHQEISIGYSPRAALSLLNCAKAWAVVDGRDNVIPEDIQAVLPSTTHHLSSSRTSSTLAQEILSSVPIL